MVHGSWFMVHGSWFMVHGSWFMVEKTRFKVHGLCNLSRVGNAFHVIQMAFPHFSFCPLPEI
jgi:hypothetical protein